MQIVLQYAVDVSLWFNFFGTCAVGISQQLGFDGGWGGKINFKNMSWKGVNAIGWSFLSIGFLIQILHNLFE